MRFGIGIITCNREDSFQKCLASIPPNAGDSFVIVNDGEPYQNYSSVRGETVIQNPTNIGVCKSKNLAFRYLLDQNLDYIFLIEDDIVIKDPTVFQKYIDAYKETGIHHFSYGFHGPANKGGVSHGTPQPRLVVNYPTNSICLNGACVGAFCFYTRECLKKVGLLDERFYQAFDHVEHTYRIAKAGMTTPYWWFADVNESWKYIDEVACNEESSVIRTKDPAAWQEQVQMAALYFKDKHGYLPAWQNCVPNIPQEGVMEQLRKMQAAGRRR